MASFSHYRPHLLAVLAGAALVTAGCAGSAGTQPRSLPTAVSPAAREPQPPPSASPSLDGAWPNWSLIDAPAQDPQQLECVRQSGGTRWALSRDSAGRVTPVARQ